MKQQQEDGPYPTLSSGAGICLIANVATPNHTRTMLKEMREKEFPCFVAESNLTWYNDESQDPAQRESLIRLYSRRAGRTLSWKEVEQIRAHITKWNAAFLDPSLILETSAELVRPFHKLAEYMEELPDDWDLLFLGWLDQRQKGSKVINSRILQPKEPFGCFGYVVNNRGLKKLLKKAETGVWEGSLDETLANMIARGELVGYACNRPVAILSKRPPVIQSSPVAKSNPVEQPPEQKKDMWWLWGGGLILGMAILLFWCSQYC